MENSTLNKQYKHDFAFGDTRGIREIMSQHMYFAGVHHNVPWHHFGYPAHEGDAKLIQYTRNLIEKLTGHRYEYVLITNGATHALNAYIHAVKTEHTHLMFTNNLYFMFYPGIAANHGLTHAPVPVGGEPVSRTGQISIIDSPSNPMGKMSSGASGSKNVIWDAAYYTPAYCGIGKKDNLRCHPSIPAHDATAGSFNKLTGLNGLRVGWLATDDYYIYNKAFAYIEHDICGVSYPSQYMALQIVKYIDLDQFYSESKNLIDDNKSEVLKLSHLFGNQDIPVHGMFTLFEVDSKLLKLLEKASVKTMPGKVCGDSRESVRFNLANGNLATQNMVKDILKADSKRSKK